MSNFKIVKKKEETTTEVEEEEEEEVSSKKKEEASISRKKMIRFMLIVFLPRDEIFATKFSSRREDIWYNIRHET